MFMLYILGMEKKTGSKLNLKKIVLIVVGLLIIGAAIAGSWYVWGRDKNPLYAYIQKGSTYPLYYPNKLPNGWELGPDAVTVSSATISYRLQEKQNTQNYIVVTLQPPSSTFNASKYYQDSLRGVIQVPTTLGEATIGKGWQSGKQIGSLQTTKTWILAIASSKNVTADQLQTIFTSLRD